MLYHFVWFIMAVTAQAKGIHQTVLGPEIRFLNVDKVWEKGFTGKGVVVAVVDHGVSKNHEDLRQNYNSRLSHDFVNNNPDPKPSRIRSHGTKCAGIIAAKLYGKCRTGIAYNAQIADIKVINATFAHDEPTGRGLRYKRNKQIHIYSNSWGPSDNGRTVKGPGPLVKGSLKNGARRGRYKRGSIFVYSSGNGGLYQDSCAFDGFVNSIYTIAIGAASKTGNVPYYAESCSSVMAATYGDNVNTSDVTGCVHNFGRTSAAAAMASGIIALLLEANNQLTWRDVQHLIVRTSRPNREVNNGKNWIVNGAGLLVHPSLGFGIMDANKLIEVATNNWRNVPRQKHCTIEFTKNRTTFDRKNNFFMIYPKTRPDCLKIKYIEHVQVELSLSFSPRGLLVMYLESPLGTTSQFIYERMYDALTRRKTFDNLVVTSLHFWGESPIAQHGKWKLLFKSSSYRYRNIEGKLSKFKITFYGTEQDPISGGGLTKGMISCDGKKFWTAYGTQCCGAIGVFDENLAKCCSGQRLVQKHSFCGSVEYDQCSQICCDGNIHPKIEGITSCCGEKSYNTATEICCNQIPKQKYKCEEEWYGWETYRIKYEAGCGYHGVFYTRKYNEKCPDPCQSSPCKNGGRCLSNFQDFTFTCECADGYQGETCKFKVCKDRSRPTLCEDWKQNNYCRKDGSKYDCAKTCDHCK